MPQNVDEAVNQINELQRSSLRQLFKRLLGFSRPVPRIAERAKLRFGLFSRRFLEDHVIVAIAVERRIEINQINTLVGDILAQNLQVVAVIERVLHLMYYKSDEDLLARKRRGMIFYRRLDMKTRITLTLEPGSVKFLDELAHRCKTSRSAALEYIIQEHMRRYREEELTRLAEEFFAEPETPEEARERRAWQKLSTEVLARESD